MCELDARLPQFTAPGTISLFDPICETEPDWLNTLSKEISTQLYTHASPWSDATVLFLSLIKKNKFPCVSSGSNTVKEADFVPQFNFWIQHAT